jgi:hypothetical protein
MAASCAPESYRPSALEREWLRLVSAGIGDLEQPEFCAQRKALAAKLGRGSDLRPLCGASLRLRGAHTQSCALHPPGGGAAVGHPLDGSCLRCGGELVCIEPLVDLLRSPFVPCQTQVRSKRANATYKERHMHDRSWLWLGQIPPGVGRAGDRSRGRARNLLLDIGASTFEVDHHNAHSGASLQWLVETYASLGVHFDRAFAWEATPHTRDEIWRGVPTHMHSKLQYYNQPASADHDSPHYPWATLARVATEEDFVVVKLVRRPDDP